VWKQRGAAVEEEAAVDYNGSVVPIQRKRRAGTEEREL